jgi:hypothetical protein
MACAPPTATGILGSNALLHGVEELEETGPSPPAEVELAGVRSRIRRPERRFNKNR